MPGAVYILTHHVLELSLVLHSPSVLAKDVHLVVDVQLVPLQLYPRVRVIPPNLLRNPNIKVLKILIWLKLGTIT